MQTKIVNATLWTTLALAGCPTTQDKPPGGGNDAVGLGESWDGGQVGGDVAPGDGTAGAELAPNDAGVGVEASLEVSPDATADISPDASPDASPDTSLDTSLDASPDISTGVGSIAIYVTGDDTPHTFSDGLAGQTPADYVIALSKYSVLTSATDPDPAPCFSYGTPVLVDVAKDNLVGSCATAQMPTGVYTHGRTKVEWARYSVAGILHSAIALPGTYTFFRAYSDTVYEGVSYLAGEGTVSFTSDAFSTEIPWVFLELPDYPGVSFETVAGECFMTFAYTKPLPIVQSDPNAHWARFHWEIFEAFRWADLAWPTYQDGQWDTSAMPGASELVMTPGVTGYHVTTSID